MPRTEASRFRVLGRSGHRGAAPAVTSTSRPNVAPAGTGSTVLTSDAVPDPGRELTLGADSSTTPDGNAIVYFEEWVHEQEGACTLSWQSKDRKSVV